MHVRKRQLLTGRAGRIHVEETGEVAAVVVVASRAFELRTAIATRSAQRDRYGALSAVTMIIVAPVGGSGDVYRHCCVAPIVRRTPIGVTWGRPSHYHRGNLCRGRAGSWNESATSTAPSVCEGNIGRDWPTSKEWDQCACEQQNTGCGSDHLASFSSCRYGPALAFKPALQRYRQRLGVASDMASSSKES